MSVLLTFGETLSWKMLSLYQEGRNYWCCIIYLLVQGHVQLQLLAVGEHMAN